MLGLSVLLGPPPLWDTNMEAPVQAWVSALIPGSHIPLHLPLPLPVPIPIIVPVVVPVPIHIRVPVPLPLRIPLPLPLPLPLPPLSLIEHRLQSRPCVVALSDEVHLH